jgi:hypothetical protein
MKTLLLLFAVSLARLPIQVRADTVVMGSAF